MSTKIIKNMGREAFTINFRGEKLMLKGKYTKTFNMEKQDEVAEYAHWIATWHPRIIDVTSLYGEGGEYYREEKNIT